MTSHKSNTAGNVTLKFYKFEIAFLEAEGCGGAKD